MKFSNIKYCDTANGLGVRVSLFVSGCKRHCPGCFNECAQNFDYGTELTDVKIKEILDLVDKPYISGLTFLGGDPMELENQPDVYKIITKFRERYGYSKDIWLYTGYTYDINLAKNGDRYLEGVTDNILNHVDIIVDGPFIEAKKDLKLAYRGSSNQRIIQVVQSYRDYSDYEMFEKYKDIKTDTITL